jgi:nitroreductase
MRMPTTTTSRVESRVDLRSHAEAIVRAATWAPSHHNAQPWAFRVEPDAVEVYADLSRRVPVADPEDRQLFIGVGAAVFGVRLALAHLGLRSVVRLAREPARPELAAVVVATGGQAAADQAAADRDARLYDELDRRRTVRGPFTDDPVSVPVQVTLTEVVRQEGAALHWVVRDGARRALAALVDAAEREQQSDPDFRAELARWVGIAAAVRGVGIPLASLGSAASAGRGAEFPLRDFTPGRRLVPLRTDRESYPGIVALCTTTDRRADWLRSGQAAHHLLLTAGAAGYAASFLGQPLEVPRLRAQVREELETGGYPQLILRLGRPPGPLPPPTPRRPLREVLLG